MKKYRLTLINSNKWLKVTAIAVILAFIPAQASFAGRGRRGGNSTGDLVLAGISGAAIPVGAGLFGSNPYILALTSAARYGLTEAGCDPQTTMLITAGLSAAAGSVSSGEKIFSGETFKAVTKRLVAAEVTYELSQDENMRPIAGMVGSLAGYAAGIGMASGGNLGEISGHIKSDMFRENLMRVAISGGISGLIRYGLLPSLVGEDSMALRMYGHDVASLGGGLAVEGVEEFGILPEHSRTYGVAQRIEFNELEQAESREATAEEAHRYEQEGKADGTGWYEEDMIKIFKEDKTGKLEVYTFKARTDGQKRYIRNMAKNGAKFMIGPNKEDMSKNQLLVLHKADSRPKFVWQQRAKDPDYGMWDLWDNEKTDVDAQGKWGRKLDDKDKYTFSYKKVPFSDKVKDVQAHWGAAEEYNYFKETQGIAPLDKLQLKTPELQVEPSLLDTIFRKGIFGLFSERVPIDKE